MRNPTGCDVVLRWFLAHREERRALLAKLPPEEKPKEIRVGLGGRFPVVFTDDCHDCPHRK